MRRILLVEDDLFIRDIYKEILKEEKYSVEIAIDGVDTLNKLREGNWDIVLLDVMMPKMSGIEILKKLGKVKLSLLAKHIILMTNTEESKVLDDIAGMYDDFILKSAITPGELLVIIRKYL
jgi:CheY-like chemotaxis protein